MANDKPAGITKSEGHVARSVAVWASIGAFVAGWTLCAAAVGLGFYHP